MTAVSVEPVLRIVGGSKVYGGVHAIDGVDFDVRPGEIHALLGENGAGKSTLCKAIAGAVELSSGDFFLGGEKVSFASPGEALRAGVAMVYQETSLVPSMTVAQNLELGMEKLVTVYRKINIAAQQSQQSLNFNVDPLALVETLGTAKRQMVEIARAVRHNARVIIFDEPTASLTPEEIQHLFHLLRRLRSEGVGIIFISHALEEALNHADRISVLRNGRMMVTGPAADFDRARLIRHMIGEELDEQAGAPLSARAPRSALPVLRVENIRMGAMVNNMSFSIFPGQVTGIAGLIGSGRSEVAKVIMGHTKRNFGGGRIWLDGREVRYAIPAQAVADGIAYVSEDRKLDGFFDTMGVTDNIGLGWLAKFGRRTLMAPLARMRQVGEAWEERLSIRRIGASQPVLYLSGGNQQKVVIAKSLVQEPKLVIFDEPTRGVDVGAIAEIRQIIRDFADSGAGVILISSYLPEILDLAQLALHGGELGGDLLGMVRVVPQPRIRGLLLELTDTRGHLLRVHHLLDGGEGGVQVFKCSRDFRSHNPTVYLPPAHAPASPPAFAP